MYWYIAIINNNAGAKCLVKRIKIISEIIVSMYMNDKCFEIFLGGRKNTDWSFIGDFL